MRLTEAQKIEKQISLLRVKLNKARDKEAREVTYPKLKKLVGTTWKYRNSYSCPKGKEDYWWVYRKVIDARKDGALEVFTVQIDTNAKLTIERETIWLPEHFVKSWLRADELDWQKLLTGAHFMVSAARIGVGSAQKRATTPMPSE